MQPARGLTRQLLDMGQKGNDVMPRDLLDLVDRGAVELVSKTADPVGCSGRHDTRVFHGATSGDLDVEPRLVFALGRPKIPKIGRCVAGNHVGAPKLADPKPPCDRAWSTLAKLVCAEVPGFDDLDALAHVVVDVGAMRGVDQVGVDIFEGVEADD